MLLLRKVCNSCLNLHILRKILCCFYAKCVICVLNLLIFRKIFCCFYAKCSISVWHLNLRILHKIFCCFYAKCVNYCLNLHLIANIVVLLLHTSVKLWFKFALVVLCKTKVCILWLNLHRMRKLQVLHKVCNCWWVIYRYC